MTTKIEWADETINPALGCMKTSPGCANCYALRVASRMQHNPLVAESYAGLVDPITGEWTGKVNLFPERMEKALHWKRTRRIFVGSMTDLFHPAVPDEFLDKVFAYMALAQQHTFIVLTKRAERMREYVASGNGTCIRIGIRQEIERMGFPDIGTVGKALPNLWLGVTVEDRSHIHRIWHLLNTPAAKRIVSVEPMLGEVDMTSVVFPRAYGTGILNSLTGEMHGHVPDSPLGKTEALDWVICGGETGPNARPMHPEWARSLRDQCAAAGVPFFFKQMAQKAPIPEDLNVREVPGA